MKSTVVKLLFILLMFTCKGLFAQDTLVTIQGDSLIAKVVSVNTKEITFKLWTKQNGSSYLYYKSELHAYLSMDGKREIYNPITKPAPPKVEVSNGIKYEKGTDCDEGTYDARYSYRGYTGAGTATCVISLLNPIVGLIPAAICSSVPPAENNLGVYAFSTRSQSYMSCYRQEAAKIKQRKVWTNWGVPAGIWAFIIVLSIAGSR